MKTLFLCLVLAFPCLAAVPPTPQPMKANPFTTVTNGQSITSSSPITNNASITVVTPSTDVAVDARGLIKTTNSVNGNLNVRSFGAVCDGVTDDTAAWNLALAAGNVGFDERATSVVANVTVPANRTISGSGILKLKVLAANDGSPILRLTGTNVTISGLAFDGNRTAQPADGFSDSFNTGANGTGRAYRACIMGDGASNVVNSLTVSNCRFVNSYGAEVAVRNITNVLVSASSFTDCNFETLFVDRVNGDTNFNENIWFDQGYANRIASGHATINADVLSLINCRNVTIRDSVALNFERCFAKLNGIAGAMISGNVGKTNTIVGYPSLQIDAQSSYMRVQNVKVRDNYFEQVWKGVSLDKTSTDVQFSGNTWTNVVTDGIYVGDTNSNDLVFENNKLYGIGRHGITLVGGTNQVARNNIVWGVTNTSLSIGIYLQAVNSHIINPKIIGNTVAGFNTDTTHNGMIGFDRAGTDETIVNVMMEGNIVLAGSANRGIRSTGTNWITGTIFNNYVDGQVELLQPNMNILLNRVTGQVSRAVETRFCDPDELLVGIGAPEGVITATVGRIYAQIDGTSGETLWIKSVGSGNTGWRNAGNVVADSAGQQYAIPVYNDGTGRHLYNSGVFIASRSISGLLNLDMTGTAYGTYSNDFSGNYLRTTRYASAGGDYDVQERAGAYAAVNRDRFWNTVGTGNLSWGAEGSYQWRINGTTKAFEAVSGNLTLGIAGLGQFKGLESTVDGAGVINYAATASGPTYMAVRDNGSGSNSGYWGFVSSGATNMTVNNNRTGFINLDSTMGTSGTRHRLTSTTTTPTADQVGIGSILWSSNQYLYVTSSADGLSVTTTKLAP